MTAATARRVAALRARASHPGTPESEAAACRELLAKLVPTGVPEFDRCGLCTRLAADPDPQWLARWLALRRRGYVKCEFACAP